jgi:glycosyltransferase involved in cell wall biosynthesis
MLSGIGQRVGSIRILYLTAESWPTFRVDMAVLFGRLLPKFGVHSDLVTIRSVGSDGEQAWGGGSAKLARPARGLATGYIFSFVHFLKELFKADWETYDAIQVRDLPLPACLALCFARRHRRPFFYWMSFPMPEGQIRLARERGLEAGFIRFVWPWIRGRVGVFLLYRWVLPRANHIFVQSDRMKTDLIGKGIPANRMTPVPMGVDLANLSPGSIDPDIAAKIDGHRTLVYIGQLERSRQIELLFEMMALLRHKEPDVLLLIVGDSHDEPQRTRLRRLASDAGVEDQVIWTGWVPIATAWGYVQKCDIGLSPIPRNELLDVSSPTKIIEYLALGLPVVCNDNPDQYQILKESGAGRCVPYTAHDFAKAVEELLHLGPATKRAMISSGREYVAKFRDYPVIARDLARVYMSLCKDVGTLGET